MTQIMRVNNNVYNIENRVFETCIEECSEKAGISQEVQSCEKLEKPMEYIVPPLDFEEEPVDFPVSPLHLEGLISFSSEKIKLFKSQGLPIKT